MLITIVLVFILTVVSSDDVCVYRHIHSNKTTPRMSELGQGKQTIVPGIYGYGMKKMMELEKDENFQKPIAILGDSRTDPNKISWNDITESMQKIRRGASISGWGIVRWALSIAGSEGPKLPLYSRLPSDRSISYVGVNDFIEATTNVERVKFQKEFYSEFYFLLSKYLKMASLTTGGTKISDRSMCTTSGHNVICPKGRECLYAFSSTGSPCIGNGVNVPAMGGFTKRFTGVLQVTGNCAITCNTYSFYDEDPTPDKTYRIYSAFCNQAKQCTNTNKEIYAKWVAATSGFDVKPFESDFYPDDGVDGLHGSQKMRRWFGSDSHGGNIWNAKCITDMGSTNITTGVIQFGDESAMLEYGACPMIFSERINIPEIPTKYATRHYYEFGTNQERMPGWALVLIGGLFGGPVGAVMGFLASEGGSVSMKNVDDEIERRVGPAFEKINENFNKQKEVNGVIFDSLEKVSKAIRHLSEDQISLQMEMTAINIVTSLSDFSDQRAQEAKSQLKAYAQKHGLPWDDSTGCVRFEYKCDQDCLEGIVNDTIFIDQEVEYAKSLNFTEVELGPRSKERLDFAYNSSIVLIVVIVIMALAMLLMLLYICGCCGCSPKQSGGSTTIKL